MAVTRTLRIVVTDGGQLAEGADVDVYDGALVASGETNSQGTVSFQLNPKTYDVLVSCNGSSQQAAVSMTAEPQTQFLFAFD